MHDPEKSDSGRVAAKPTNKAGRPAAEPVEPRPGTKGNADQQSTHRTQSRVRVTQALDRVRQGPTCALTSNTRGRSRMPKSGQSGSVRGAPSNGRPYRDVRRETGKEFVVQVHFDEGVAIHIGPEPCAGVREDVGEASAGEHIGQPSSREIVVIPGADAVHLSEGKMDGCANASARPTWRGLRPWHVWTLLAREPGDLWIGHRPYWVAWSVVGR
jgi:hypothetical protein